MRVKCYRSLNKQPYLHFIDVTYKSHQFSSLQLVDLRVCVKDWAVSLGKLDGFKQLRTSFIGLPAYLVSRKWKFEVGPKSGFSPARSFCYPWPRNQQWMYKLQSWRKFWTYCKVSGSWNSLNFNWEERKRSLNSKTVFNTDKENVILG